MENSDIGIRLDKKLNTLALEDGEVLIAENKQELKHLAKILVEEAGYVGLRLNESKTKYLQAGRRGAGCDQHKPLK